MILFLAHMQGSLPSIPAHMQGRRPPCPPLQAPYTWKSLLAPQATLHLSLPRPRRYALPEGGGGGSPRRNVPNWLNRVFSNLHLGTIDQPSQPQQWRSAMGSAGRRDPPPPIPKSFRFCVWINSWPSVLLIRIVTLYILTLCYQF